MLGTVIDPASHEVIYSKFHCELNYYRDAVKQYTRANCRCSSAPPPSAGGARAGRRRGTTFSRFPEWKAQQKILWAKARKGSVRGKSQFTIRDLLTDVRCSQAVLDFLSTTDVGRLVPTEEDARSEASEWELRELREREAAREAEAEELGAAGELGAGRSHHCSCLRLPSWHPQTRTRLRFSFVPFFCLSLSLGFFSFVISLVGITSSWDRPGQRAKGSLQRAAAARTADKMYAAIA